MECQVKADCEFKSQTDNRLKDGIGLRGCQVRKYPFLCLVVLLLAVLAIAGCGTGGYPGGGIMSISEASIILDAGQSQGITTNVTGDVSVAWSFSGSSCNGSACGTLSSNSGSRVTYFAPKGIKSSLKFDLVAAVANTTNEKTVQVTVNPDPKLSGELAQGTVGSNYSAKVVADGGTAPLALSMVGGTLPDGLSFDSSTGVISGVPTTPGTSTFVVQVKDSSMTPFVVKANESITVLAGVGNPLSLLGGAQPEGEVGLRYSTSLKATGGVTPYAWSVTAGLLPPGLSISASTGIISGVPTVEGQSNFIVQVKDESGESVTAQASILVKNPLSVVGGKQPDGIVGEAYTTSFLASGGLAPYRWSIESGTLPAGLTIAGTSGEVTGTPTLVGSTSFTVRVTDTLGANAFAPASITVRSKLQITNTLPNGVVGAAYTGTIDASGGLAPYACAISGALPPGLAASGCQVSGTPTKAGSYAVTVSVTDTSSPEQHVSEQETIQITGEDLALTNVLPNGEVGVSYRGAIGAVGGKTPYSCSISGALPPGLSLAGCIVEGTPTAVGAYPVHVSVTDSSKPAQKVSADETIVISASNLEITNSLPNGTVGILYSGNIAAAGGTKPYSCSISGALPPGLAVENCVLSGTPTRAGSYQVSVKVTDSESPKNSVSANETVVISPAQLTATNTLPNGTVGVAYTSTITATGGTTPYACSISGSLPNGLTLTGCTVSGTPTRAGSFPVTVTVTDSGSPAQHASTNETVVINNSPLAIANTLPNGTVGVAYSSTIGATGGASPYFCSIAGGLPPGLSLTGCVVSGTPTTAGSFPVTVTVTDSASPVQKASENETIVISPPALAITNTLPGGTVGISYSAAIDASGGTTPYTCSITGALPAGLNLTGCVVSGTPSKAGSYPLTVKVTDSSSPAETATATETITIASATLTLQSTLGNGTVGVTYTSTIEAAGGTMPYKCTITGTLPPGLTQSNCTVSGTPTQAGGYPVSIQVTDSSATPQTVSANVTVQIAPAALTITSTLPNGTVGVSYSANITAADGTAPYSCSITGTLPAGLSLSGCIVSGTPTKAGSSNITVKVTDSGTPQQTASEAQPIAISPAVLNVTGNLPNGTVGTPYSATITATGGTKPYSCSITGTLPAGLTLAGCTVSGTPTKAGSSSITVMVTDSGSPKQTASSNETITINPAALTLTSTLPNGTVGVIYSATIGASGGTPPYACSVTGTLPGGLSLSGCTVSGTPSTAGSFVVNVKVTDSGSPAQNASGNQTIVISPAALAITGTLPNGTVGVSYTATITATGGTTPYTCSIIGTLPSGLILNGCVVSGTPTTAGSFTVTIKVTDSGNPAQSATVNETIVINPASLSLTGSSLPNGTVGVPYNSDIGVTGGTSPYNCVITSGMLPAGLAISGCTVSGTPTTPQIVTVTVKVTDSGNPAQIISGPETITINPAALTLTSTLPNGTVGVTYSATITATGGTTPYSCSITGTLPLGLTLTGCTVSGMPTTPGSSPITITVTDSSNPTKSASDTQTIVIAPSGTLSLTAKLPVATVGVAYAYTLHATGGTPTYSYSISAGALPPGITLQTDGLISGTPTSPGASSFTVTVTDSAATPATFSLPLVLLVEYPSGPNNPELNGPYAFLFQGYDDVVAGVLAYHTATIGSFTADGLGGISAGELDANHQSSNPSGTTVPTQSFLGTYEIGADSRGMITITTLNPDGTTDQTFTYAVSLKAPVSPATVATQGSLIEFDNNQLVGTKGSGTLLAQTPAQFSSAFNGSYAFGLSGETPCLVSCTVGIASGPVAAVGQFVSDGAGTLSSGVSDANVATLNFANAPLMGSYQPADSNGRIQLEMTNTSVSDGLYPNDFAVYVVNANEVFIMSTDKHSAYDLLAGTAQLQSSSSFTNAAMNGPFVGYENAQQNPGLLGTTLQSVLSYSVSTVFRASGNGAGTCNTTNVDTGGLTSLVDNLTGVTNANKNNLITALLGSYGATGTSSCTITSNGRGVFDYPNHSGLVTLLLQLLGLSTGPPSPRVVYLTAPGTGYFLETGYAGLGQFQEQTGAPFSLSTLDGTYVESTIPASSLASVDDSGHFTSNGAGKVTSTLDENVGVGTLNVLELGETASTTYSLSDPNTNVPAATAGRYVLADTTTVIYSISPEKFVMVDTNPLTTSPAVTLLY